MSKRKSLEEIKRIETEYKEVAQYNLDVTTLQALHDITSRMKKYVVPRGDRVVIVGSECVWGDYDAGAAGVMLQHAGSGADAARGMLQHAENGGGPKVSFLPPEGLDRVLDVIREELEKLDAEPREYVSQLPKDPLHPAWYRKV